MPEPTLPMPTEPVPYFDPTAARPLVDPAAPTAPVAAIGSSDPADDFDELDYPAPGSGYGSGYPSVPGSSGHGAAGYGQPAAYGPPPPPPSSYSPPMTPPPHPAPAPYAPPQQGYAAQQPGNAIATPSTPAPVVAQIGDIRVSSTTIYTPNGEMPLQGSQWLVTDQWHATQKTPTWAIVLAIVLFFCLTVFSLLFLLAKEVVYTGMVQVVVTSGTRQHVTRIPVSSQGQVTGIHQQVNYVRSLASM